MSKRKSPISATVDFDAQGVQHGFLKLPISNDESAWGAVMIPVTVIANGEGPTALLTGGNHGDEYEGITALQKLSTSLKAEDVKGRVIIVPMMNTPAAQVGRRTSPMDGGNLNRSFPGDPDGSVTPLDSHIRLANPRTHGSERNLILRRPFNYSNGVEANGQLDMGLLFIAYQADLQAGFITVQQRLDGEPLEEYIKPVGGGYFFTLPGVQAGDFLGSGIIVFMNS